MIKLTSLILLQLSIAIAAPQNGFKFFSDLGNLEHIEGSATEAKVIPKEENHDEVEPSSFVVIDDRELEEPQDSLIPNEDSEIQNAKEAKFDQEEDEIIPDLTEIVSSSEHNFI